MRVLPATVSPFPGETVRSLYNRLVERNSLTAGELWTAIRKSKQGLPLRTTPEAAPDVVARLDDLPANWFDRDDTTNRLFSRCIHNNWAHAQCARCSALPKPVTMCRRCASGMKVEVQSRAGAFCARHERWHYDGRDEAIGIPVAYARAERCLTGTLWARGIGLDTGEIELACEIISTYREFVYRELHASKADGSAGMEPVINPATSATYTITTLADGTASIPLIRCSDFEDDKALTPARSYYLVETVAPNGYELLAQLIPFTILKADVEAYTGTNIALNLTVENVKKFELPLTGGTGAAMIYLAGFGLIAGGVLFLVIRRRGSKNRA